VLGNQILEQSTVGLIYKKDLLSSLEKTGFDVESLYGDFNGSSTVTDLLIVEARKPKSF
jgi:hypothetical protein